MVRTMAQGVITGVGIGQAIAIAPAVVVAPPPRLPDNEPGATDPREATLQALAVIDAVASQLEEAMTGATGTLRETLEAAVLMAQDPELADQVEKLIHGGLGPASSVDQAFSTLAKGLEAAGGYLAERVTDLMGVRHRVIAAMTGQPEPGIPHLTQPSVVIAQDLSPADTAKIDLALVAAIVTVAGTPTSHTAIIANQLGIPCVVAAPLATSICAGTLVAVEAATGTVTVDPPQELQHYLLAHAQWLGQLAAQAGPGVTNDGHEVELLSNIGSVQDAQRAAHTAGVGLLRTEVLFLDRSTPPTTAEQTEIYRRVLQEFKDKKVVVRTLDAGADKPLEFVSTAAEPNPALGVRGYRTARHVPRLLADQLTAIASATSQSAAQAWVMAPMISTPHEAKEFADLARSRGITTVGVMIEVPAAVIMAEHILEHVDFLSIGTNDLAQYTMATDRLCGELADLLTMWEPAVLRLIDQTCRAGLERGKPVGVCGEMANDPILALVLTGLGVTSLSMAPSAIPLVRYCLSRHSQVECERMALAALTARSADQAQAEIYSLVDPEVLDQLKLA